MSINEQRAELPAAQQAREQELVDQVVASFGNTGDANGKQAEGGAIGQFFALEKRTGWAGGGRSCSVGNRRFGVSEFRLPLR